jgi:hypothetical protein
MQWPRANREWRAQDAKHVAPLASVLLEPRDRPESWQQTSEVCAVEMAWPLRMW